METKVSTKGQVVLPGILRRKLGIRAGDPLDISVETRNIILTPRKKIPQKTRIITDHVTGLPVLSGGKDAPTLTSREVEEILSTFP
jgi:AbrB family looped-hinge helix DNA binding protein